MKENRKAAILAGVLFIAATAASVLGSSLSSAILKAPNYLTQLAANQSRVTLGVLLTFLAAACSTGIALALYPTLRKYSEGLALGSVVFRAMEAMFYLISAVGLLCLVALSHQYVMAGSSTATGFEGLGSLILAVRTWAGFGLGVLCFSLGALMYYTVFFRTRLIPRWLSGWGVIAIALLLTMAILVMFGAEPAGTILLLAMPLALQEIVMAVWLIAKGFDTAAIASASAQV